MEGEMPVTTISKITEVGDNQLEENAACECDGAHEGLPEVRCVCQSLQDTKTSTLTSEKPPVLQKKVIPVTGNPEKKPKLRTSKDIYDRLKWDSDPIFIKSNSNEQEPLEKIDVSSIYIGYKDRFLGICELPFNEFTPGGEIPFHRLYYFRTGGPPIDPFIGKDGEVKVREDNLPEATVFIWDRESRTDLIFHSGNSSILRDEIYHTKKQENNICNS